MTFDEELKRDITEELLKISNAVYHFRKSRKLSQLALAEQAGIDRSLISRIENMEKDDYHFSVVLALSRAGIFPMSLLDEKEYGQ